MAAITTNAPLSILNILAAPFTAMFAALISLSEAQEINREANYLFSLSDDQLAQKGLKREDLGLYLTRKFSHY